MDLETRIEKIQEERPEWTNKQVEIQAIGEYLKENTRFAESMLLTKDYDGSFYGILWINQKIDYIPPEVLKILGENAMCIKKANYNRTNQIEFY